MKQFTVNEMDNRYIPIYKMALKNKDHTLNITHVITLDHASSNKMYGPIMCYDYAIEYICKHLGIRYTPIYINTYSPDDIVSYVQSLNDCEDIDGILIDYPFISSIEYITFQNSLMIPTKDIDMIDSGWDNFGKYFNYTFPAKFIIDELMMYHMIFDEMLTYKIITNNTNSHKGIIPYRNYSHNRYIFMTNLFKDELCYDESDDIIISLMRDVKGPIWNYKSSKYLKDHPKLIVDFGYKHNGQVGSINDRGLNPNVPYYTWLNGLCHLHIYAVLKNLIMD